MSRQTLMTVAKLLFVIALMVFVFYNIQWEDAYVRTTKNAAGDVVKEEEVLGKILGEWNLPQIEFREKDSLKQLTLTPGPQGEFIEINLTPGLPTYWRWLDLTWLILGALCYFANTTFAGTRWWWLLGVNKLPISFLQAQKFNWIGIFFNNVVPGQTGGDLVRAIYVMKRCHGERVPAIISVIVDRIMGLGSLAVLAAIAVLFYLDNPDFRLLAYGIWGVCLMVCLMGVVAFSRRVRTAIRLGAVIDRLPPKFSMLLKRVDQAVYFYRSHKLGMGLWMLVGIGNHVVAVLSWYLVAKSLGLGVPIADFYVLVPVILIVSAVPIAPNGWGVGEALFGYVFKNFCAVHLTPQFSFDVAGKVMATRGVALSVLYRIHLTMWSLLGGVIFFFSKDKVTRADMKNEVKLEEEEEQAEAEHKDEESEKTA